MKQCFSCPVERRPEDMVRFFNKKLNVLVFFCEPCYDKWTSHEIKVKSFRVKEGKQKTCPLKFINKERKALGIRGGIEKYE